LTAECRQQYAAINLRFTILRREAESQFLEHGMAANYVQKFLDHAKPSTSSRYLNANCDGMHAALERFEDTRRADERRAAWQRRLPPGLIENCANLIGRCSERVAWWAL
jgi:hypothetical protein